MSKDLAFNVGDTVMLKSGGPIMTVKAEHRHLTTHALVGYYCQWFAGKKLEQGEFPPEALKAAPTESKT